MADLRVEDLQRLDFTTGKFMLMHPSFGKPPIYVRECYSLLYSAIKDRKSLGFSYIHISGDPGIGKSCFLWYVLVRLLNDVEANGSAIILEDVREILEISPDRRISWIASPTASDFYKDSGTWLLTDQAYAGFRARLGTTLLFASPKRQDWEEVSLALFVTLFMPPFPLEELKAVYFRTRKRTRRNICQFWTRYYLFGPVMRWYEEDKMKTAFAEVSAALTEMVDEKMYDATRLRGAIDTGLHCHRIFSHWPTEDFSRCAHVTFMSEWAARAFASKCYRGEVDNWLHNTIILSTDPQLRTAAGFLFERYAHHRLSRGGDFADTEGRGVVHLEPREMKFFSGNKLKLDDGFHHHYLRPNSSSSVVDSVDSIYLPDVFFQISIAKARKPISASAYSEIISSARAYMQLHPGLPSGVREATGGVEQPYFVLVTMEGDPSPKPPGLLVEVELTEGVEKASRKRPRRVTRTKQDAAQGGVQRQKRGVTMVPFQMTIALGAAQDEPTVDYENELSHIYELVAARIVGDEDPDAVRFKDIFVSDMNEEHIEIVMRQGHGVAQYTEGDRDDDDEFGVWIEAQRVLEDALYTTTVNLECTRGTFSDDHELKVFVNERLGTDNEYDDFARLVLPHDTQASVVECEFEGDTFAAELLSPTKALVTIRSSTRDCKCFCLVVGPSSMVD